MIRNVFLGIVGCFTTVLMLSPSVFAAVNLIDSGCVGTTDSSVCAEAAKKKASSIWAGDILENITSVAMYVLGALAVIMLVYAGFRYVTSQGDSKNIQEAKNIMLYTVIGVIVAFLAYAIIVFVVKRVT